jgi:hypothetical protein
MPRVAILRFTKDYATVVEAFKTMVKDAIITEREESGRPVTDIEGDFEHFVLEDMDMWKTCLKIEIKNNRIDGSDDRESRAIISEAMPGFGEVMFSPTIAFVYKRVETITKTTTIVEKLVDGEVKERNEQTIESETVFEWEDITREFAKKVHIQ